MLGVDVKRKLVDQGSFADVMFQDLHPHLGLSLADLSPYLDTDLSSLGEEQTRPLGYLDIMVTYGRKRLTRTIKTTFLVRPLITSYHYIVGRPMLARLGVVASAIHLKVKFQSLAGNNVTISADLEAAQRCQYLALKGSRRQPREILELPPTAREVKFTVVDARYDPDNFEDEGDDDLARELKKKIKRPEPHGEFLEVPLGDDPVKTVKFGAELTEAGRESLIACLRPNAGMF